MKLCFVNFILSVILLPGLPAVSVFAQENTPVDSTSRQNVVISDTAKLGFKTEIESPSAAPTFAPTKDTLTTQAIQPAETGLDTTVFYSARFIDSYKSDGITYLIGNGKVRYKNMTLEAGKITVFWNKHTMMAEGLPDTTNGKILTDADTLETNFTELPVFSDGKEKIRGFKMEYNFKTERGRITRGRSVYEGGYYFGKAIKRVAEREFNIANGTYTTCSNNDPHFHFAGKKMKIILDDKVIAKPVIFFIGKIPVAILPFAVFSSKPGRHSGIIVPRFGSSPREGRYLRNMGYYWATNDYTDMRFTLDFFERTGFLFRTHMNYALRYHFRGTVSSSFARQKLGEGSSQHRWDLRVNHNQEIDQTTRLSVSGTFVSNNSFYRDFSNNREQRLSRQLISNATLSKSWSEGRNSMSLNLSQTKDLETGATSSTLPRLQINRSQSQFFPFKPNKPGSSLTGAQGEAKWYNYLYYSYNGTFLNSVRKDSTGDPESDVSRRADHVLNFNFSNPNRIFGWLSLSQSINYKENWFDRTKTFSLDPATNTIQEAEDKGFAARRTFSLSVSANTKLYGTFFPNIGPVKALRHVMTPSISFSYQPDFSDPFWGYFQTLQDTTGKVIKRDRFGGTPSGEQRSLSYSLNNLFQMKIGEGEKEKKIDLFTLIFNGGYNFAADSLNWQNLSTSFRANPRQNLGISMGMIHSFYDFDPESGSTVNKLLFNKKGIFNFLRLTQFRFDANWTLRGRTQRAKQEESTPTSEAVEYEQVEPEGSEIPDRFEPERAFSAFDVPWRANLSFSFSINRFNPTRPSRTAYVDLSNVEVQLTKNWRIGYRIRYDIANGEIADQRISFYRDLHCWEAQFNWSPTGIGKGFYFKINIKAPHLQDIKIEQQGGTTSIFSPF